MEITMAYFMVLSQNLLGETEDNNETSHSGFKDITSTKQKNQPLHRKTTV
jgi:hypothetical protein